jgi:predicted nucleotidyltransferase
MAALIESDSVTFHEVLDEVINALGGAGLTYVLMGGVASVGRGGHRLTHDIDVFCKPLDADKILRTLAEHGFETERTDPKWLFKAFRRGVLVDVIFQSSGPIFLDDEMVGRAMTINFNGRMVRSLGHEDLLVIKALVLNEHTLSTDPRAVRHLLDLLTILRTCELDWDYLLKRARQGPRRVLSMLIFAQSLDLLVPDQAVKSLVHTLGLC